MKDEEDYDYVAMDEAPPPSYFAIAAYKGASLAKFGFVQVVSTATACFAAIEIAPRATPYVVSYFVPNAAASTVLASTITGTVGTLTFTVARYVASVGTEASLNYTGQAMSNGLTYIYNHTIGPARQSSLDTQFQQWQDVSDDLGLAGPVLKSEQDGPALAPRAGLQISGLLPLNA